MRVTDEMVGRWLVWARNFGEVVSYRTGSGRGRRFRVRVAPGVTRDGAPLRPRTGTFDILGHDAEDVVPAELMLTAREALVFAMGCAVGRVAVLAGDVEYDWQRARRVEWEGEASEAFVRWREEAREADREESAREHAEREAERLRARSEYRRRREGDRQLEGVGGECEDPDA